MGSLFVLGDGVDAEMGWMEVGVDCEAADVDFTKVEAAGTLDEVADVRDVGVEADAVLDTPVKGIDEGKDPEKVGIVVKSIAEKRDENGPKC